VDGKVLESDFDEAPIVVYQGTGDLPPGADRALLGLKPGQTVDLTLAPDQAFGPHDPKKVRTMTLQELGDAGKGLKAGRKVLGFLGGKAVTARVLSVEGGKAVLDLNPPLAGKTVVYRLQVVATKPR
jgi:FKBP-type peptidyl-prolyl cis-trans isomerase SlpA